MGMEGNRHTMRKYIFLLFVSIFCCTFVVACGKSSNVIIDYADAESFESALNAGENLEGKVVQFVANELHPKSIYGYNIWAGEHLNFVSERNPDVKEGDTVVVRTTIIKSNLQSWIIEYEKVENAVVGENTISSSKSEKGSKKDESVSASATEKNEDSSTRSTDSSNTVNEKESKWIPSEMTGTRVLGNMSYSEPTEWNPTEAKNGWYYYPYGDKQTGLVYVSFLEIEYPTEEQLNHEYQDYIVGSVKQDLDAIHETKAVDISGLPGYYAEITMSIKEDKDYGSLEYIVHDGQYLYSFLFGDKGTLTDNMRKAADTMIKSVQISKPEVKQSESEEPQAEQPETDSLTMGQRNALNQAKSYLSFNGFSHDGLVEQLTFEGYSEEDAIFAADNCGADWNEQALRSAQSYLSYQAFSASGLKEQLEFGSYTSEQADYAVENCGADWNEQARKAAESYLSMMSFSRDQLIQQLEFEGYTSEQAEYGVSANGY